MKKLHNLLFLLSIISIKVFGQVSQFPQVYYNNQGSGGATLGIHSSASLSASDITRLDPTSKVGVEGYTTSTETFGTATWAVVCLPSTTGSIKYGYMLYGQYYIRIDETNKYATVVNTSALNIRTAAGTTNPTVTMAGSTAQFGEYSIVALTGQTSYVNGVYWYEVYLTDDCSTSTGWLASSYLSTSYLSFNSNTSNYYNVAGTVETTGGAAIWGATITIGSSTTNSTEGFYQYKVSQGTSVSISCSDPGYNTISPSSYSYTSSGHVYNKNFTLSNTTCTAPSTTDPSSLTVIEPTNTSFSVTVSGSSTTIQWQYNTGSSGWLSVPNSSPYSGVTSSTLTINPTSTSLNGYQYRCYVTSSCTSSTATSNPATLTVNSSCSNPTVISPSNDTLTTPGTEASFSVSASEGSGYSYQWQVNTGSGWSNISTAGSNPSYSGYNSSATLSLSQVSMSQNGYQYRCTVTNGSPCTSYSTTSSSATLSVVCGAATITIQPKNKTIQVGSKTTFSVSVSGTSPTYQWYKNGVAIAGETTSSHTTTPVVIGDNGYSYYCVITNCSGNGQATSKSAILTVTQSPIDDSTAIGDQQPQLPVAEPVQVGTGTYIYRHTQMTVVDLGVMPFTIYYNSLNHDKDSCLGHGMAHSFMYHVINRGDTAWDVHYPDGHRAIFIPLSPTSNYSNPLNGGIYDSLIKTGSGFTLITKEKVHLYFNIAGKPLKSIDPNGNTTRLVYSGNNLDSVISPGGRWFKFHYNSSGKMDSVRAPSGRSCYFIYDASDNLITASEPAGDIRQFRYDAYHQMDTLIDEKGVDIVINRYDSQNRVVCQKDAYLDSTLFDYLSNGWTKITFPDGSYKTVHHDVYIRVDSIYDELGYLSDIHYDYNNNPDTLINENSETEARQYDFHGNLSAQHLIDNRNYSASYDTFNKPVTLVDARNNTSNLYYDGFGNPDSVHLANGAVGKFVKNSNGTVKIATDGEGNKTYYYYNSYQQIDSITYPWDGTKRFYHGLDGRLDSMTDENGHTSRIYYDLNFNAIQVKDALNQSIYFAYDLANQIISFTDKRGIITRFHNDKKGRITAIMRALGVTDSFGFDSRDNMVFWLDGNQHFTRYVHDRKNELTSIADSSGKDSLTYDKVGNIAVLMDATGVKTTFAYEHTFQLKTMTDALNDVFTTGHDQDENINTATDALTHSYKYQYNQINQLDSVTDPNGNKAHYSYDSIGIIKTVTDNNNITVYYHYTHRRLDKFTDGKGNIWQYYRDLVGNDTLIKTPIGNISVQYDAINRPYRVVLSSGEIYVFHFDPDNNITSDSCSLGVSYFEYNSLNRLTKYTDPFGNVVSYGYDQAGNRRLVKANSSYFVSKGFDADNRLKTVIDLKGKTYTYTRDAAGKEQRLDYGNGDYDVWSYDGAGRLYKKQAFFKNGNAMFIDSFGLDAKGQRNRPPLSATFLHQDTINYAYSADNALASADSSTFISDNAGNIISEKSSKDSSSYAFSTLGRLISYTRKGNHVVNGLDAFGNRDSRTVNGYQTNFINDVGNPLVEILQMTDKTGKVKWSFVYGTGLLGMIDSTGKSYYVHSDCSHNVVAITDDNDSLIATYTYYDPFGNMVGKKTKINQPFTWGGEYGVFEEDSSFYNIRARCYDASKECFIQPDPLEGSLFNPQSLYNHGYGLNDPSSVYDFSGLSTKDNEVISAAPTGLNNVTSMVYNFERGIPSGFIDGFNLTFLKPGYLEQIEQTYNPAFVTGYKLGGITSSILQVFDGIDVLQGVKGFAETATGVIGATLSLNNFINNPNTANVMKIVESVGLFFVPSDPIIFALDLTGANDWLFNKTGGFLDKNAEKYIH